MDECVAVCPLGYYSTLLRTCLPCGTNCNVCLNNTYCDVCASNYYRFTVENTNTASTMSCVSQCPSGYTNPAITNGKGQCSLCPSYCISCADTLTCTQCVSSMYVILSGQCVPYNCLNCNSCDQNNNVCNQCNEGYYLFNSGCVAFCPNGYYGDSNSRTCKTCIDDCLLCFSANTCKLCIDGY